MTYMIAVLHTIEGDEPTAAFENFTSTLPESAVFCTGPLVAPDTTNPDFDIDVFRFRRGQRIELQSANEDGTSLAQIANELAAMEGTLLPENPTELDFPRLLKLAKQLRAITRAGTDDVTTLRECQERLQKLVLGC
jgi:hypothetical protein